MAKKGLYANINARKKAGTSRIKDSKKKSDCPAFTYNVLEGDSIRYEKKCCK